MVDPKLRASPVTKPIPLAHGHRIHILDDVLIGRYRSGKLSPKIRASPVTKKARDTSTGAWVFGLSLVVLAWTDGKRRIPLAFLPYFGEESKLDLALALLE
ncbi:hypothetical protein SAMN04488243_11622 [Thermus arciformis]|uniref:Uncharacterized protein n=1 Tax=Thermus arciformis TaxID=482827 RepID=A0A1G7GWN8_9DEIN|nr:hypothetical protein SAMN04488243_11622 [Thermus arciformis]